MFHLTINCLHCFFLKCISSCLFVESYLLLFIFLNLSYCIVKSYIYIFKFEIKIRPEFKKSFMELQIPDAATVSIYLCNIKKYFANWWLIGLTQVHFSFFLIIGSIYNTIQQGHFLCFKRALLFELFKEMGKLIKPLWFWLYILPRFLFLKKFNNSLPCKFRLYL